MPNIHTTIEIDAPPERVWAVLSDLEKYDEWNPFMKRARADLETGGTLSFVAHAAGRKTKIVAKLLRVEENHEIRWAGPEGLLAKVFRGEHFVRLDPSPEGKTTVTHGEEFGGAIPNLAWGHLGPRLEPSYHAMNDALKARVERSGSGAD